VVRGIFPIIQFSLLSAPLPHIAVQSAHQNNKPLKTLYISVTTFTGSHIFRNMYIIILSQSRGRESFLSFVVFLNSSRKPQV